jgi:hypothetical protein
MTLRFILFALLVGLAGCTSGGDARLPVAGRVLVGDQALSSGAVILRPDITQGNTSKHEPRGSIDAEGNYQISTALQPGAALGWYKIGIVATEAGDPKNPYAVRRSLIPARYNDPDQSGLSLEVVKNPAPGAYDLRIKAD